MRLTDAELLAADDAPAADDSALVYRAGVFTAVCQRRLVHQRFTRPYRPETNERAERFIQTAPRA